MEFSVERVSNCKLRLGQSRLTGNVNIQERIAN